MLKAHAIKGNVGWVGASRLHYAAFWIQKAYYDNDFEEMIRRYPHLIETLVEFRRYSNKVKENLLSKPFPEKDSDKEAVVAEGYKLQFDEKEDYVYCLLNKQTVEHRKR
jgi:hypothetical protein